jgi:hypothetical protein
METLEQIKELTELLSVDTTKFYGGNKSAGTRARKSAQELKALLQKLRGEILENNKTEKNAYYRYNISFYICFHNISVIEKCR